MGKRLAGVFCKPGTALFKTIARIVKGGWFIDDELSRA
jgi:hypothetical protein